MKEKRENRWEKICVGGVVGNIRPLLVGKITRELLVWGGIKYRALLTWVLVSQLLKPNITRD